MISLITSSTTDCSLNREGSEWLIIMSKYVDKRLWFNINMVIMLFVQS